MKDSILEQHSNNQSYPPTGDQSLPREESSHQGILDELADSTPTDAANAEPSLGSMLSALCDDAITSLQHETLAHTRAYAARRKDFWEKPLTFNAVSEVKPAKGEDAERIRALRSEVAAEDNQAESGSLTALAG